ncbi:hypothetical protein AB4589_04780 [Vibrio sp. 10N.222.49.A3]
MNNVDLIYQPHLFVPDTLKSATAVVGQTDSLERAVSNRKA